MKKSRLYLTALTVLFLPAFLGFLFPARDITRAAGPGRQELWPYRPFAYAGAYLYNLENRLHGKHAVIKEGKLDPTVAGEGVRLSPGQVKTVIDLTNRDIAGLLMGLSKSYIPHHGIVFYSKDHRPVAYITFCFDCEAMRVFPPLEPPPSPLTVELPDTKIKELLERLEAYKQVILDLKLPAFDTPFEYAAYAKKRKK